MSWLPSYVMELPNVPEGVAVKDLLPLFVELNLDDFKITKTVTHKPTPLNLVFKGIPFEEQEKMRNIFLLGNVTKRYVTLSTVSRSAFFGRDVCFHWQDLLSSRNRMVDLARTFATRCLCGVVLWLYVNGSNGWKSCLWLPQCIKLRFPLQVCSA